MCCCCYTTATGCCYNEDMVVFCDSLCGGWCLERERERDGKTAYTTTSWCVCPLFYSPGTSPLFFWPILIVICCVTYCCCCCWIVSTHQSNSNSISKGAGTWRGEREATLSYHNHLNDDWFDVVCDSHSPLQVPAPFFLVLFYFVIE